VPRRRKRIMKGVELKLISELIKNSRRSDRELAKQLHVSQPTVSRIRNKLEKEGIIREYTMIPDFIKLGYQMASVTLAKMEEPLSRETIAEISRHGEQMEKKNPSPTIVAMNGIGCNADYVTVAFHKTYTEYAEYMKFIGQFPQVKVDETKSFIIDLCAHEKHLRFLTISVFADYLLRTKESP
jgi:DNA-binding Lrp family transcriptional regulator